MRLGRIASPDGVAFASIDGEGTDRTAREIAEHPFGNPTFTGRAWPLDDVRLLAPILASKVVCIGKNYADHVAEMNVAEMNSAEVSTAATSTAAPADPVMFLKPNTSIVGPGAAIVLPPSSSHVDFEGELAVVIGRPCKDVPATRALDVVLGYTVANDVTARDHQEADGQWTRGKGHDTFCPLGPWIETQLDPSDVDLRTEVDGTVRQDSSTAFLLHDVPEIIAWVSAVMTLLPGDVILTGTPSGVGPLTVGQQVSVTIADIGTLTNPVASKK